MQLFAALDFETASSERNSACAIGYVIFNHSKILKKQAKKHKYTPCIGRSHGEKNYLNNNLQFLFYLKKLS